MIDVDDRGRIRARREDLVEGAPRAAGHCEQLLNESFDAYKNDRRPIEQAIAEL